MPIVYVCTALVAELRMLSSGDSSVMVSNPASVKSEHLVRTSSDKESLRNLLEPRMLFDDVYPESLLIALRRPAFADNDAYHWKKLGYWLCYQLASTLKASDAFSRTVALKVLTDVVTAFLKSLHAVKQRYLLTDDDMFMY